MIDIRNLSITYGTNTVLSDFSIQINKGDKICLYGNSGCGKTSLLNAIAGIVIPSSGEIIIDGTSLSSKTIRFIRQNVGYLPQLIDVPLQSFDETAHLLQLSKEQINKARSISTTLGLQNGIFSEHFQNISGGEKQRLLISAVLSQSKQIFLLDEPSSALDQLATEAFYTLIHSIPATVISVSHNTWWIEHSATKVELCRQL